MRRPFGSRTGLRGFLLRSLREGMNPAGYFPWMAACRERPSSHRNPLVDPAFGIAGICELAREDLQRSCQYV